MIETEIRFYIKLFINVYQIYHYSYDDPDLINVYNEAKNEGL